MQAIRGFRVTSSLPIRAVTLALVLTMLWPISASPQAASEGATPVTEPDAGGTTIQATGAFGIDIDPDEPGSLEIGMLYHGEPPATTGADCSAYVAIQGPTRPRLSGDLCRSTSIFDELPPGDYLVTPPPFFGDDGSPLLPPVILTVMSETTTTYMFDITPAVGIVTGTITINGQPPEPGRYTICGLACQGLDGSGRYALMLPAGHGSIEIGTITGVVDAFAVDVVAGQTTELGTTDVTGDTPDPPGAIRIIMRYQGQDVDVAGAACRLYALITDGTRVLYPGNACDGPMTVGLLTPGDWLVTPMYETVDGSVALLPAVSLVVTPGGATTHTFDVTAEVGIVSDVITVGGRPPGPNRYVICATAPGYACEEIGADGRFALMLPAGAGSAIITNRSGVTVATLGFTVLAGQTAGIDAMPGTDGAPGSIDIGVPGGEDPDTSFAATLIAFLVALIARLLAQLA